MSYTSARQYVEAAPPAPHTNLMTANEYTLLIHGYIRNSFNIERMPTHVIDLFVGWLFANKVTTYEETLDVLLNEECCLRIYDFKIQRWRVAVYVNHWDHSKRIIIRFVPKAVDGIKPDPAAFFTMKDFPVNYTQRVDRSNCGWNTFQITRRTLTDLSSVPSKNIDEWTIRTISALSKRYRSLDLRHKIASLLDCDSRCIANYSVTE
eukprot:922557_1